MNYQLPSPSLAGSVSPSWSSVSPLVALSLAVSSRLLSSSAPPTAGIFAQKSAVNAAALSTEQYSWNLVSGRRTWAIELREALINMVRKCFLRR